MPNTHSDVWLRYVSSLLPGSIANQCAWWMCASWWLGSDRSVARFITGSTISREPLGVGRPRAPRLASQPGGDAAGAGEGLRRWGGAGGFWAERAGRWRAALVRPP